MNACIEVMLEIETTSPLPEIDVPIIRNSMVIMMMDVSPPQDLSAGSPIRIS
jgi:hypothetical protein